MNRLNTLMNLILFTNANFRNTLKEFLQTDLYDREFSVSIDTLSLYDNKNNIINTFEQSILKSKLYIGLEHNASDEVLQRMILYSLIFSFNNYPNQEDWNNFIELPREEKMEKTIEGISVIASSLLVNDIKQKLLV